MANKTINDLTVTTSAAADDLIPIWRAANSDTRHITKANLIGAALTGGGTIATGGFTLTLGATSTVNGSLVGNMTGGGTVATGGFTLTVPATGTASLLGTAQTYSALKTFSAGLTFGKETLSEYDEDSGSVWLPTLTGDAGNPTITYTAREHNFVRVGKKVSFAARIIPATFSGGSGNAEFSLPFTVTSLVDCIGSALTLDGGVLSPGVLLMLKGTAKAYIYEADGATPLQISDIAATDNFYYSGTFFVD